MNVSEFTQQTQCLAAIDAFAKAKSVFRHGGTALVSISGGSDSDIVLDLLMRCEKPDYLKFRFVWFDTGLEFQATKDHLRYLEEKYGITIERRKAEKPIPYCVRQYGIPFLSKYVSEMINRLQRHHFQWTDESLEVLLERHPRCQSGVKWWCNAQDEAIDSPFNVGRFKWLKEFLIANPPDFPISASCCYYAKKKVAKKALEETEADLNIVGVRKYEGGIRAKAYKNCYTIREDGHSDWRPLFWFTNEDKRMYEEDFGVTHSRCYTEYGFDRTGCVGCPFSKFVMDDLAKIEEHEPRLYKACMHIFGKSYEYTRKYREFQKMMNEKQKRGEIE